MTYLLFMSLNFVVFSYLFSPQEKKIELLEHTPRNGCVSQEGVFISNFEKILQTNYSGKLFIEILKILNAIDSCMNLSQVELSEQSLQRRKVEKRKTTKLS